METLLDRCTQPGCPTMLVLGDIMCDVYIDGKVCRLSPEAPVPVFENAQRRQVLGGAANVAANLVALGCAVHLVGVVGTDTVAQDVRELLQQQQLADTWLVEDTARVTTQKTRLMVNHQHLLRLDQENRDPLQAPLVTRTLEHALALVAEVDAVICSDYGKGVCTSVVLEPLFRAARSRNLPIFVAPKVRDFALYQGATVIIPNLLEFEQASGAAWGDTTPVAAVETLLAQSQAQALLVTRGKDGMTLFHPPRAPFHIPAQGREVFDVTGAGDTVIAAFSMAAVSGLAWEDAARLANVAAGLVVSKMGTAVVSRQELRAALRQEETSAGAKILSHEQLQTVVEARRQRRERIVFTNGCFDLLHVGHIQYLQQARALGDCLVVALNDDASVSRLKGQKRPLVPQTERAQVLAALACVDYVALFSEATPLALIQRLCPDVLVKGGDYTPETVVGRAEVEAYGGEVRLLPHVDGVSTTDIIQSIVERYGASVDGEGRRT